MDKIVLSIGFLPILTVRQIEATKPKEKPYRLLDGNGPYLYVPASGEKVWQSHYRIDGKEGILTVGKYPPMTLQEARDKAWTARKDVSVGIDPIKAERASFSDNSFSTTYKRQYKHKEQVWSISCTTELVKMFDDDILPIIGGLEIQDIEPMQLLEIIHRLEDRGAMRRANRAHRGYDKVFRYTTVTGRAKYNPAPNLADAMKGYRRGNFPFFPAGQIPTFNKALATFSGSIVSLTATKILHYTALRTKGLRSMLWKNVDFKNRIITINTSVIEGRKIHVVPMLDQVVELLTALSSITKSVSEFVFAGRNDKKRPVCENAVLLMIKQINYEGLRSGHRFRRKFSTIMSEHEWPADVIEVQLTRANGGSARGIYNRAQYLDKRREIMQWWAG